MGQTNFTADSFGVGRKSGKKAGLPKHDGAEKNQPESAFNEATYYDEESDSGVNFKAGAQNEFGGDLVKDPTDATDGQGFSDVGQDLPDHMIRPDEDGAREEDRNAHVDATVDEPMGNTEDAETKSASGVTANRAAKKTAKKTAKKSAGAGSE